MFCLKAIKGLCCNTVESYPSKMPCLDQNAFIHCGEWFRQRLLLEFYREQCEQRVEPEFQWRRSEQRQQEQHKPCSVCAGF